MNKLNENEQSLKKSIKILLIIAGTFFVGIGIVGIFIPILPTTPFLLISAALYAKSSKRFYGWILKNKIFGRYIKNYREGRGISLGLKTIVISLLWVTIICSLIFIVDVLWLKILMVIIAIGVSIHVIRIKPVDKGKI